MENSCWSYPISHDLFIIIIIAHFTKAVHYCIAKIFTDILARNENRMK